MTENILFALRKDYLSVPGGDTTQILKTKEFIERRYDVEIEICTDEDDIFLDEKSEIVHIFDLREETFKFINAAKKANKKIILSPICWDLSHSRYISHISSRLNIFPSGNHFYNLKNPVLRMINLRDFMLLKHKSYGSLGYRKRRKNALIQADIILPNSPEEIHVLSKEFNVNIDYLRRKSIVVPNAVDLRILYSNNSDNYIELDFLKDFVLEVARIEPIKNQMNVIKALYDVPHIPIVFVGKLRNERFRNYYQKLRRLALERGNVFFIEELPHEMVYEYYKRARVHVLPSFRESTGLASLEALASGCEIVVSSQEYCPVEYYEFEKRGFICNPYDPISIKDAVIQAFNNPKKINIDHDYINKFSYENVADLTFGIYKAILNREKIQVGV